MRVKIERAALCDEYCRLLCAAAAAAPIFGWLFAVANWRRCALVEKRPLIMPSLPSAAGGLGIQFKVSYYFAILNGAAKFL